MSIDVVTLVSLVVSVLVVDKIDVEVYIHTLTLVSKSVIVLVSVIQLVVVTFVVSFRVNDSVDVVIDEIT